MKKQLVTLAALAMSLSAMAEITLPDIIGDNMVLQQQSQASLWGWATPNAPITVTTSWNNKSYTTKTASNGRWDIKVATAEASYSPYTISIKGDKSSINISNVLLGEVWFCSGQSNMEMPLRGFWTQPVEGGNRAIAYSGKYPGIRVVTVPKKASYTPQDRVEGKWKTSSPANAGEFSAMAYFFAQSLTDILNVPVGIISCSYGGSKVEGWLPKEIIDTYPEWDIEKDKANDSIQEYERINVMYNAMLRPLIGYTIKGFLWNQGESNVGRDKEYPQHLADMVSHWREQWGQGELPFYFVELPAWKYSDPNGTWAAIFRECQHRAAKIIPNSGIICTSDLIYPYELEDIHASRKQELGERMAFLAANRTYGISGIACDSPVFKSMDVDGKSAVLHFDNANDGFTPNQVLEGFEAAGSDHVFHPAQATEVYNTRDIKVTCEDVDSIVSVRYNFKNFAVGKVFNLMHLPLIPFRTDNWDY
jgi:sialate O-acetylesterase